MKFGEKFYVLDRPFLGDFYPFFLSLPLAKLINFGK